MMDLSQPVEAIMPTAQVVLALGRIVKPEGIHVHKRLHKGYARRFNEALERGAPERRSDWSGCQLHNLFWAMLSPSPRLEVPPPARDDLEHVAGELVGSGWVAVSQRPAGDIICHTVQNHDYPWGAARPLMVLDLWEHAYVGRLTERAAYVSALIDLVDWSRVEHLHNG